MSGVNVRGCTGNLAHTQHLIEKGGVLEMFCRIMLDYLKGRALKLRDRSSAQNGVCSRDYRFLDLEFTCLAACRARAARLAVPLLQ